MLALTTYLWNTEAAQCSIRTQEIELMYRILSVMFRGFPVKILTCVLSHSLVDLSSIFRSITEETAGQTFALL